MKRHAIKRQRVFGATRLVMLLVASSLANKRLSKGPDHTVCVNQERQKGGQRLKTLHGLPSDLFPCLSHSNRLYWLCIRDQLCQSRTLTVAQNNHFHTTVCLDLFLSLFLSLFRTHPQSQFFSQCLFSIFSFSDYSECIVSTYMQLTNPKMLHSTCSGYVHAFTTEANHCIYQQLAVL